MTINKQILKKSAITGIVAITFDYIIHYSFTSPQETLTYYFIKFILVALIAYVLFKKFSPVTLKRAFIAGTAFTIIFGFYYRLNEVLYKTGYLSRVPDIFGFSINENFYIVVIFWYIAHYLAFISGLIVADKNYRQRLKRLFL